MINKNVEECAKVRKSIMIPMTLIFFFVITIGVIKPNMLYNIEDNIVTWATKSFGWLFQLSAVFFIYMFMDYVFKIWIYKIRRKRCTANYELLELVLYIINSWYRYGNIILGNSRAYNPLYESSRIYGDNSRK